MTIDIISHASRLITSTIPEVVRKIPTVFGKELSTVSAVEMAQPLALLPAAKLFVRVAGVSGLLAVGLGAYGAHGTTPIMKLNTRYYNRACPQ